MQKYEQYKNSGVEWLGEIPEHWEVKKFKFVLNQTKGLTITKRDLVDEGILCVNYGEIHSKFGFKLDTAKNKLKCVDEKYLVTDSNSLLNKGDFVFADTSEDIQGSGNFTHLMSNDKTFAGYHTVIARPKVEISSLFFAFLFDSISFRNQIRKLVKGVKVYSITQSVLKETNVWIPSIKEQTAIANFLEDKTTKIDQAIAIKHKQIELLKERRQILIHKAVTRGLDENVKMKDSGVEWIGEIPEHWEVKKLKYIATYFKGYAFSSSIYNSEGIAIVKAGNIKKWSIESITSYVSIDKQKQFFENFKLLEGDIIISTVGSKPEIKESAVGQLAIVKKEYEGSYLNQNTVCIRPKKNAINKFYLKCVFTSNYLRSNFDSIALWIANQAYIEIDSILEIMITLPPIEEQILIFEFIESTASKIANSISLKEQEIEKLKEYKMSLIDGVVTGKVKFC